MTIPSLGGGGTVFLGDEQASLHCRVPTQTPLTLSLAKISCAATLK